MNWDQALRRLMQFATVLTFITQPVSAQLIGGRSEATNCSNAIVGNVRDSTINVVCGTPPEQLAALVRQAGDLSETQKKLIANLESQLDLNQRQIRAALEILGENNIPPERLASKLVEIAERFKELQLNVASQPGDDLKITALKADAQRAIDAGDLAKADGLLADIETEQRGALERLAVNAADTLSRAETLRSRDCAISMPQNISRRRPRCSCQTTTSALAISPERQMRCTGKGTNSATMMP
jgi:hypothetical protein